MPPQATMTYSSNSHNRHLAAHDSLSPIDLKHVWRVASGVLRIDSAPAGECRRFVRLALPGDIIGVEQWAGTDDSLRMKALIASELIPVTVHGNAMMSLLMETVVQAHQRCRDVVSLRSGPVAQRIKTLLLMFSQSPGQEASMANCAVPNLSDFSDIVDAAPETVSRVFASMRAMHVVQGRAHQRARFSRETLRNLEIVAGMTAARQPRPA